MLCLVRVRKPGNVRGKVLVPFASMAVLMLRLSKGQAATPTCLLPTAESHGGAS